MREPFAAKVLSLLTVAAFPLFLCIAFAIYVILEIDSNFGLGPLFLSLDLGSRRNHFTRLRLFFLYISNNNISCALVPKSIKA